MSFFNIYFSLQFEQSKHAGRDKSLRTGQPREGKKRWSRSAGSGDLQGKISKKRERFWEVPAPSNHLHSDTTCARLVAPPLFALTVSEGPAALGRFSKVDQGRRDRKCEEGALS